jgi:hypothetical protein
MEENEVKLPQVCIVISDGELGLFEAFAGYVEEQQRCHWHIKQDLYHAMHQDGWTMKDSNPLQDGLAGVLAIELPEQDFKKVCEAEKDELEERMEKAEAIVDKLIAPG